MLGTILVTEASSVLLYINVYAKAAGLWWVMHLFMLEIGVRVSNYVYYAIA